MSRAMLVGCGAAKADETCPAEDLYTGPLFRATRRLALARGWTWGILSGKHGFVMPHWYLAPYDARIPPAGAERDYWVGRQVADRLRRGTTLPGPWVGVDHVELFMGATYADAVRPALEALGYTCSEPLRGLVQGARLRRLNELRKKACEGQEGIYA